MRPLGHMNTRSSRLPLLRTSKSDFKSGCISSKQPENRKRKKIHVLPQKQQKPGCVIDQKGKMIEIEEEADQDKPEQEAMEEYLAESESESSECTSCSSKDRHYLNPGEDDDVTYAVAFVSSPPPPSSSTKPTMVVSFRSNGPIMWTQLPGTTKFIEHRYAPYGDDWAVIDVFTFKQRIFAATNHGRIAEVELGNAGEVVVRLLETESYVAEGKGRRTSPVLHHVFEVETDDDAEADASGRKGGGTLERGKAGSPAPVPYSRPIPSYALGSIGLPGSDKPFPQLRTPGIRETT